MAEWDDLVAFVRVRFEIMRQSEDELWFRLPTTADRTQLVVVRRVTGEDDHPWAEITPHVLRNRTSFARMLELAGESVVGGAVAVDGVVLFRHSIPFGDTALDGFDRPFRLVVDVADRLEHELTGADEH